MRSLIGKLSQLEPQALVPSEPLQLVEARVFLRQKFVNFHIQVCFVLVAIDSRGEHSDQHVEDQQQRED